MMSPFEGGKYSVRVDPGKFEIILMKAMRGFNFTPAKCEMNVILGDKGLRALAIEKNFKIKRSGDEIYLYKAWHDNGFITLYKNDSVDKILTEMIDYTLEGLVIEDEPDRKQVSVYIGPGEEQMIKLVNKGKGERNLNSTISLKKILQIKDKKDGDENGEEEYNEVEN